MKKRTGALLALALLVCLAVAAGACRWQATPPRFALNGITYTLTSQLPAEPDASYTGLRGEQVGAITQERYVLPVGNNQGFKIPPGSKVYSVKRDAPEFREEYRYCLILEVGDTLSLAHILFSKASDVLERETVWKQFDERYYS